MSLPRRIFYNTLAQSLGKVFAAILGLVTIGLLSQYLNEGGFGQYSTILAFLGFFAVIADFGLYLYVVREISKPDTAHGRVISNALGLRLVVATGSLLLGAVVANFLPYDAVVKNAMFVGILAFLFVSLNQVLIGIFQKHLVQHLVVISETVGRAVNLILVYLFVTNGLGLSHFILALVLANALVFLVTLLFAQRYEKFGISFDLKFWREILAVSWPLIFSVIFNLVYFKTDTIFLSLFHTQEVVGVYSLPYKILEGSLAFPAMFVGLIMPLLSSAAFVNWEKFRTYLQKSFDAIFIMVVPVVITVQFFAFQIIKLVRIDVPILINKFFPFATPAAQDPAFLDSPPLLQILILAAAVIFFGTLFGFTIVAVNQQKNMLKGYLLGAAIALILYLLLIPKFSYWGAAIGTIVTEIIVAGYAYRLIRKASGQGISAKILLASLPAATVLALYYWLIALPWIFEVAGGLIIYALILILTKAVPFDFVTDLLFLKKPETSIVPPPHE